MNHLRFYPHLFTFTAVFALLFTLPVHAQGQDAHVVQGQVVDAQTDEPLPGVNVVLQGTTQGTTTNIEGEYDIEVPSEEAVLVFSFVGYVAQEVSIDGRQTIDVALSQDVALLEDLVVVGYGTQRREALTASVARVDGTRLAEQPAIQTSAALMGAVPGVQVTQSSGQPGSNEGTIRIRGIGTLGDSNPLVLIDGIEGALDDVPSSDIEDVSILKDASAAAIYGSRAANGVILVTTKRGQRQAMQVNYSASVANPRATRQPEFADAGTVMRMDNEGAVNLGADPVYSEDFIRQWEENHQTDPDNFPNTDWVEEVFSETAIQQRHNLGVTGGGDNYRYRASLQYDDETAEIVNYRYQRYNMRLNSDVELSDVMSVTLDANVTRADQKEPTGGLQETTRQAYRVSPIFLGRFGDGSFGPGRDGNNPAGHAADGGLDRVERYIYRGRLQGLYEPLSGLQLRLTYAPEVITASNKDMTRIFVSRDPETGEVLASSPARNSLTQVSSRDVQHNANFTVNYLQNVSRHTFDVMGGTEYVEFNNSHMGASRQDFPLQDFEQINAGSAANQLNWGSASEWKLLSFFGRVNYDYDSRYMLTANMRYDGSSRFMAEHRWGLFPALSAAWRISEESFMEPLGFLDELKLRGSWGMLGNQNIGTYPFAAVVNFGEEFVFGGDVADGAAQLDLANPDITWETTTTVGVGVDVSLYDRLALTFDWFNRTTEDILLQLPIPRIIGMNPPFQNAGVVENTGWELEAVYSDNIGADFSYNIGFNTSNVNNRVVDLHGAGPFIGSNSIIKEGYPINSIYGFVSDGLFRSESEVENHAEQPGNIAPGDIRYVDLNGDGVINPDDRAVIGNPFPAFNYGLNLSASYRNLDLSVMFQGVGSRDVLLQGDAVWALQNAGKIQPWQIESRWTPENPEGTFPRLTRTSSHNNFETSDFWVYDASYLRLRNLQVGYTAPATWTDGFAEHVRVYFLGHNLFTLFDDMPPGVDPNVPSNTVGNFFPIQRMYSLGLDITF